MTQDNPAPIYDTWTLDQRDSQAFVAAILNPPEPNDALKAAATRYKARMVGRIDR